jgi:nucleotide-binding universal stress UspA family protein
MSATERTIVVGVDGSARSADAFELGITLGHPLNATTLAVHVEACSAARGLQRAARRHAAEAIVVGPSHRSRFGRVFPGGTAERLLAFAACPVAIAPRGYSERKRATGLVGCAFDGSPESRAALAWTKAVAGDGMTIRLLTAEKPLVKASAIVGTSFGVGNVHRVRHPGLARNLADAERELRESGLGVEVMRIEARTVPLLEQQSCELDLLVLGSHGFGPARAALSGSVSNALVRTAACPLVVVPRSADDKPPITAPPERIGNEP